jgi:hypothetical protein
LFCGNTDVKMSEQQKENTSSPEPAVFAMLLPFWLHSRSKCLFKFKQLTGEFQRCCHVVRVLPHENLNLVEAPPSAMLLTAPSRAGGSQPLTR